MKFIFTIRIKEGHSEAEYIDAWKKGSAIIQQSTGAKGTILYRNLNEPNTFIAIAEWESKEARDAAMKKLQEEGIEVQTLLKKHKDFGNTETLGNFEEIARVELQ